MASQSDFGCAADRALFATAARIARDRCQLHKAQIADRAGMNPRMLHRLTTGATRATESQRDRILTACNLPTMTSRLLAESNHAELIGTPSHDWLELFVGSVVAYLALIKAESGMEVDGRWATSDAALIFSRWQTVMERRREVLTDYFCSDRSTQGDRDGTRLERAERNRCD